MKRAILICIIVSSVWNVHSQATKIKEIRENHLKVLLDTNSHKLNKEEILNFGGLDYFDFDTTFQVKAKFTKDKGKKFKMPTSTDRTPIYRRYGYADFIIGNDTCRLELYQNISLRKSKEYKDFLFLPFRDKTSAIDTYGGGRFLDLEIPKNEEFYIDFNLSYNPYCAYSHRYSCPIPPVQNTLNVEIRAGEKTPLGH